MTYESTHEDEFKVKKNHSVLKRFFIKNWLYYHDTTNWQHICIKHGWVFRDTNKKGKGFLYSTLLSHRKMFNKHVNKKQANELFSNIGRNRESSEYLCTRFSLFLGKTTRRKPILVNKIHIKCPKQF